MKNEKYKIVITLNVENGCLVESLRNLAFKIENADVKTDLSYIDMNSCVAQIDGIKDYQNSLKTFCQHEAAYNKDNEIQLVADALMGKTYEEVEKILSEYDKGHLIDGNVDNDEAGEYVGYASYMMLIEEIKQCMKIILRFNNGKVYDVNNEFVNIPKWYFFEL